MVSFVQLPCVVCVVVILIQFHHQMIHLKSITHLTMKPLIHLQMKIMELNKKNGAIVIKWRFQWTRDILSKKAEILELRLQQCDFLKEGTKISLFHSYLQFFKQENYDHFCTAINAFMYKLWCEHVAHKWTLFIDSRACFKIVIQ